MHTYIHTYMHTYIHTYMHTYLHAYILTYIQTYMHTYMHAYIHTYMHAYIHTWYSNEGTLRIRWGISNRTHRGNLAMPKTSAYTQKYDYLMRRIMMNRCTVQESVQSILRHQLQNQKSLPQWYSMMIPSWYHDMYKQYQLVWLWYNMIWYDMIQNTQ